MRGRLPVLFVLALAVGACATTTEPRPESAARPAAPPPTAAPAAPPAPSKREVLAGQYRTRAEALEREGELRRALDYWEIALAIKPDDQAARDGRAKLQARIEGAVATRISEARAALARGAPVEARKRLLSALALDPGNRTAFQLLQTDARETPFISHTVRSGDTLAALAQRYYGDRARSEVIWEANRLPTNPRLVAGTQLKIPEIPGVPFVRPDARPPAAPPPSPPAAPPVETSPPRPEPPQEPEVNPLLADAREALDRSDYGGAIADVDRFLAGHPANREGLDIKKTALYRQGKQQLDQRQYTESYKTLGQLVRLQPDYQDSPRLLQQARTRAVERHYNEGLRLYREEKLPEAIREWRVVLEVDPQHANAQRNIEQAERLLKGLEQRRKR